MRLALRWIVGSILLILAGAFAAVSIAIYATFGFSNSLSADGFQIPSTDLENCGSLLIDVNSLSIESAPLTEIVGEPEAYLTVALSSGNTFTSSLVETSSVDEVLLGRSTCTVQVNEGVTLNPISPDLPSLKQGDLTSTIQTMTGVLTAISLPQSQGVSIFIELPALPEGSSALSLEGLIVYPNSQLILQVSAVVAVFFLLGSVLTWIVTRKKPRARDTSEGAIHEPK
jgi:hypothetical protein